MADESRTHIVTPLEPAPAPPLILLPEHAGAPRRSMQYFSGAAALVLMFFASASFTVAYLSSGGEIASADSQTAAATTASADDPFASVSLIAEGAYVLDLATNRILYSKNPDAQFALVASSNEGASILTEAAEDAILVKYPSATQGGAALWRMNDIAKNLGLSNMVFLNTNGLDESGTQAGAYGSSRDVALLFGYAAQTAPAWFEHTSRDTIVIRAKTGETIPAVNTDEAPPAVPGIIMGKTGYTELAGGNLAVVFEVGPAHPIVAVVMRSTQDGRFSDMKKLVAATVAAIAAGRS